MNFRDFLDLAEDLAQGTTEAEWRTCVSRAYYGAFHVAGDFLRSLGFRVPRSDRGHGFAWLRLSNSGHTEVANSGRELKDLRSRRNAADYQDRPAVTAKDAEAALIFAQTIVSALDAALDEPVRTQVRDAMKIYEKDVLKEVTWQP